MFLPAQDLAGQRPSVTLLSMQNDAVHSQGAPLSLVKEH